MDYKDFLDKELQQRITAKHRNNGVIFLSLDGVLIHSSVEIGEGTVIYPGTILEKNTVIGKNAVLGPNSLIQNSSVGDASHINSSQIYDSSVGSHTKVGPFAHMRPNSHIGDEAKLGNFTEMKNSTVGNKSKVSHLSYIGDSEIGEKVNFGCGAITINYDGKKKNKTIIEDEAFIGCNVNLVAPIKIGKSTLLAAGSTITQDVPDFAMGIARERQTNKNDYMKPKKTCE